MCVRCFCPLWKHRGKHSRGLACFTVSFFLLVSCARQNEQLFLAHSTHQEKRERERRENKVKKINIQMNVPLTHSFSSSIKQTFNYYTCRAPLRVSTKYLHLKYLVTCVTLVHRVYRVANWTNLLHAGDREKHARRDRMQFARSLVFNHMWAGETWPPHPPAASLLPQINRNWYCRSHSASFLPRKKRRTRKRILKSRLFSLAAQNTRGWNCKRILARWIQHDRCK